MNQYDALLLIAFGGPEGQDEVIPFMENVLRGRNIPRARMEEVSEHYRMFGGVSPLNAQNRALIAALEDELKAHDIDLPIYWGNRNWHPFIADTLRQMHADGVRNVLVLFTAAYGSYSSCRQYREDIAAALEETGITDMDFARIRAFFNHPGFVESNAAILREALAQIPAERRDAAHVAFTAHSIPTSMADVGPYVSQLNETIRLLVADTGAKNHALVYQSRSGPPSMPWLEPDICDHLSTLKSEGVSAVVVSPLGFVSDHMEVLFDLDVEAKEHAAELNLPYERASTPGNDPRMVDMIVELIRERLEDWPERRHIGKLPPKQDVCPENCCPRIQHPRKV